MIGTILLSVVITLGILGFVYWLLGYIVRNWNPEL